jgi:arabinose-5-phosphate isomerase
MLNNQGAIIMTDALVLAKKTISTEIDALQCMSDRLGNEFDKAVELIAGCEGRVIVVGMGKSGIIGQKIAATLASTGTSSFFVHPGDAFHGDLGMIKPDDIVLLISNSGETEEIVRLISFLKYQKNPIIALTGNTRSTLANHACVVLDVFVEREACANNLAPTSSTTATLVMGDALAVTLSAVNKFQPEDFARFHPGGSLGRKLLTRVKDVMHQDNLPLAKPDESFKDIVSIVTAGKFGLAIVMDGDELLGVITDGDIRRALDADIDFRSVVAADMMTENPRYVSTDELFYLAEEKMLALKISALVVKDADSKVVGVLQIYD